MLLKSVKIALALWILLLPTLAGWQTESVQAAEGPGQAYLLQAGDYNVTLKIDTALLKTSTAIPFSVQIESSSPDQAALSQVTVVAEPFSGLSATPVKMVVKPTATNSWQGELNFPVAGNWYLVIQLETAQSHQTVRQNIVVAPPPALPDWVAWLIAGSPLVWFGLFFTIQGRQARRKLKKELVFSTA